MECMAQEPVLFEDILCQIIDMIGPEVHFFLFSSFTDGFCFPFLNVRVCVGTFSKRNNF